MKLAIELTTSTESEDLRTVRKLAEAALAQGHQVSIFLMDDGVYHMASLADLATQGADIRVCTHNTFEREVTESDGVTMGGQNDWAEMVNEADRVVVFG